MREIKFRAWDKVANEICKVCELSFDKDGTVWGINDEPFVELNGEDGYILMQYTGLKDKNGKEIYEGDIIEYSVPGDYKRRRNIEFTNGGFGCDGDTWDYLSKELGFSNPEIIGNIYENSELLK